MCFDTTDNDSIEIYRVLSKGIDEDENNNRLPVTNVFICEITSGVHMEKRVFSKGFVSPISNSGTVRPRPINRQIVAESFSSKTLTFGVLFSNNEWNAEQFTCLQ